jgi:hypothetical protein
MRASRRSELGRRLEAYFATLRPASLKGALKRTAGNCEIYAAVSGSALAMMTGASVAVFADSVPESTAERAASVRSFKQCRHRQLPGPVQGVSTT